MPARSARRNAGSERRLRVTMSRVICAADIKCAGRGSGSLWPHGTCAPWSFTSNINLCPAYAGRAAFAQSAFIILAQVCQRLDKGVKSNGIPKRSIEIRGLLEWSFHTNSDRKARTLWINLFYHRSHRTQERTASESRSAGRNSSAQKAGGSATVPLQPFYLSMMDITKNGPDGGRTGAQNGGRTSLLPFPRYAALFVPDMDFISIGMWKAQTLIFCCWNTA